MSDWFARIGFPGRLGILLAMCVVGVILVEVVYA